MSTRVQKGSTVFRPIAKPRARLGTETRQTSVAPDVVSENGTNATQIQSTQREISTMPPPSIIPLGRAPSAPPQIIEHPPETPAPSVSPSMDMSMKGQPSPLPSRDVARPPAIQAIARAPSSVPVPVPSSSGNAILVPSRETSAPMAPAVSHRPSTAPIVVASSTHIPLPTPAPPIFMPVASTGPFMQQSSSYPSKGDYVQTPHSAFDISQIDPSLMQPPQAAETHLHVLGQAASSVIDSEHARLALNTESVVKTTRPRRKTTRDYSEQDTEGSEPQVGTRRKRKAKSVDGPVDAAISTEGVEQPSRKRRSKKQIAPDNQPEPLEGEHYIQEGQARRASTAPRRSRTRQPSLPPFDPDADPGAELDPTATTMAALCNDTGQGRVSTKAAQIVNNHIAWRAANREKRARLKAAMEAKKYGRNVDEEESGANAESQENNAGGNAVGTAPGPSAVTSRSVSRHPSTDGGENDGGENDRGENTGDDFDYTQNLNTSRFNVQVRIGPNGETIIDEDSLFVNRDEEQDTADYTHVEESDTTKFVNSSTYSKKVRGSRWSAEETELFYDALSQFGENYELISYVLPGRDRKACKNKFKAEDKKDPARITYCLTHRRPYDIATLSRMTGKDFSGPTPEIRAPTPLRSIELDTNRPEEPSTSPKRVVQKKSKTSGTGDDVEVLGDLEDIEKAGLDESLFDSL